MQRRCVTMVTLVVLSCLLASVSALNAAPTIDQILIQGRVDSFWDGNVYWWEAGFIWLSDPLGPEAITSVEMVDPEGVVHPLSTDVTKRQVFGSQLQFMWWESNRPKPPSDGVWQVTATSPGGTTTYTTPFIAINPLLIPVIHWPLNKSVIADTVPLFRWTPLPNNETNGIRVDDVSDPSQGEVTPWAYWDAPGDWTQVVYNFDGMATQPSLLPGHTYTLHIVDYTNWEPAGDGLTYMQRIGSDTPRFTISDGWLPSLTSFEQERHPWTSFAAGPGEAATWRGVTSNPRAHSGANAVTAEVTGEGTTGLRLPVPSGTEAAEEYTFSTWVYSEEGTPTNSSNFVGFAFSDNYPSSTAGWNAMLGVEWSAESSSVLHLLGDSQALPVGLSSGRWHQVRLHYVVSTGTVQLWIDGVLTADTAAPTTAGLAPSWSLMGVLGQDSAARRVLVMDDASVTVTGPVTVPSSLHLFGSVETVDRVLPGQEYACTLRYGEGYPLLGGASGEPVGDLFLAMTLPPGDTLISADPTPGWIFGGQPVWRVTPEGTGQSGFLHLQLKTPSDAAIAEVKQLWLWSMPATGETPPVPPNPPDWTSPTDPTWGVPRDVLSQVVEATPQPDAWVRKEGPRWASPGDTLNYVISVGNRGLETATNITVLDELPIELGGGTRIVGNLASLVPGELWQGLVSGELQWGVPDRTTIVNAALIIPSGPADADLSNNYHEWTTTSLGAHDPNRITVTPTGGVDRGDTLTYTLECENTGLGTAYGVYVTALLDPKLEDGSLALPSGLLYDSATRTLFWEVGMLLPDQSTSTTFSVNVGMRAKRARPIIGQATVYFPSVPEETPTNVVANIVQSTFSDVAWDSWAILPIEQTYEHGIVQGYPDGTYRPAVIVNRGQMATYVARTLAGGEALVPSGPAIATFTDVPVDNPYFKYVEYAVDQNVVQGYSDNTYRPAVLVNRGQMAIYIARALVAPGGDAAVPPGPSTPSFPDIPAEAQAYRQIEYIVSRGVVGGYPDGTYRAVVNVTRDQMAVYVARAFALPQ